MDFTTGIFNKYAKKVQEIKTVDFYTKIWQIADKEHSGHTGVCSAASCLWGINSIMQKAVYDFNLLIPDNDQLEILWNAQKIYEEANPDNFLEEVEAILSGFRIIRTDIKGIENQPLFIDQDFNCLMQIQEYFGELPENTACLLGNSITEKDGHVFAFYKKSEREIFFFDVNEGIYTVKDIRGLLNTRENQKEYFSMVCFLQQQG